MTEEEDDLVWQAHRARQLGAVFRAGLLLVAVILVAVVMIP